MKRAGFQSLGKFLFVWLSVCFVSFLYPQTFRLLPQSEFLAFLHSLSSHGAVYCCTSCHPPKSRNILSLALDSFSFLESRKDFLTPRYGIYAYSQNHLSGCAPVTEDDFPRKAVILLSSSQKPVTKVSFILSPAALTEFCNGGNVDHTGEFSILKNIQCQILGKSEEPISLE